MKSQEATEEQITRFEREVQLTSQLTNPNTVAIYDYGRTSDGTFYYVMEYLSGFDLARLVEEAGPLPEGRVIYILAQACSSLAEAHSVGLIHRDIKPSNIMICQRGGLHDVVKVLDFGLVKELENQEETLLTAAGFVSGTPGYLSPESIKAPDGVDRRGDIYCLGAVGYFLLTGSPVFDGTNAIEIMSHHLHTSPQKPSDRLDRPVSADLEDLLLQCLEKDRELRPSSAEALRAGLAACHSASRWAETNARDWWTQRSAAAATSEKAKPSTEKIDEALEVALGDRLKSDG